MKQPEELRKLFDIAHHEQENIYYYGSRNLDFPDNRPIEVYLNKVGVFEDHQPLMDGYRHIALKNRNAGYYNWKRFFIRYGVNHDPYKYLMVPTKLHFWSTTPSMHRYPTKDPAEYKNLFRLPDMNPSSLGRYPHPLRQSMDGDDEEVLYRHVNIQTQHPCVFCLLHEFSDHCWNYKTPFLRMSRFQEINYTLWRNNYRQICESCFERERHHVGWEQCLAQINCQYCRIPGHHRSICNSISHLVAMAHVPEHPHPRGTKRTFSLELMESLIELDIRSQQQAHDLALARRSAVVDKVKGAYLDDKAYDTFHPGERQDRIAEEEIEEAEEEEREKELHRVDQDQIVQQRADPVHELLFQQQSPDQEHRDQIVEKVVKNAGCSDKPYMDLHEEFWVLAELKAVDDCLAGFKLNLALDREKYASSILKMIDIIIEKMKCSTCKKDMPAVFFCMCGRLKLCSHCVTRRYNWISESERRTLQCPICTKRIVKPLGSAMGAYRSFQDISYEVLRILDDMKKGVAEWMNPSSPVPNFAVLKDRVLLPSAALKMQAFCSMCCRTCDSAPHMLMKSMCGCGAIVCRSCTLMLYINEDAKTSRKPFLPSCSRFMTLPKSKCVGCTQKIKYFGTCEALTLTARFATLLYRLVQTPQEIESEAKKEERSLRQYFVYAMENIAGRSVCADGTVPPEPAPQPFEQHLNQNQNNWDDIDAKPVLPGPKKDEPWWDDAYHLDGMPNRRTPLLETAEHAAEAVKATTSDNTTDVASATTSEVPTATTPDVASDGRTPLLLKTAQPVAESKESTTSDAAPDDVDEDNE